MPRPACYSLFHNMSENRPQGQNGAESAWLDRKSFKLRSACMSGWVANSKVTYAPT